MTLESDLLLDRRRLKRRLFLWRTLAVLAVVATGLLASDTPKGPVSLRFPVDKLEILFPRLFPET